jgi:hypothetical protein
MVLCEACRHYLPGSLYSPRCAASGEEPPPLCYVERIDPARCGETGIHFEPRE